MNEKLHDILTGRFYGPVEKIEAIQNATKALKDKKESSDWSELINLVCNAMSEYYPHIDRNWLISLCASSAAT